MALALLTIIKRDRYASAPVVDRQVSSPSQASKFDSSGLKVSILTLVVQRNTKGNAKWPHVSARMMKNTANLVRRSCITLHCRPADDFHAKTRLTSRIMRVDTRNSFFRPISEEIARLLICVLSHDDVIASGA